MPRYVSVQVEGLRDMVRDLESMGVEVADLKDAFGKIARKAADFAADAAPVRSGTLRGSIRGNRAKAAAVVIAGRARVRYAGPINYGWPARNIKASNFMQKADKQMAPVAERLILDDLDRLRREKGFS